MRDLARQWIADHAALSGLLGCGVREPGGDCICQTADATVCPAEKLEKILRQLVGENLSPAGAGFSPCWHTWIFAEGKIRFVRRPDGWILVAVVRPDAAAAKTLETLAAGFLALAPGN